MKKSTRVRIFFERNGFAVCSRLAEILGMKVKSVRLFFIYASFTTLIGGFVLYLTLAFWLKLKDLISSRTAIIFLYGLCNLALVFLALKPSIGLLLIPMLIASFVSTLKCL